MEVGFGQTPPVFSKFAHFPVFFADVPNGDGDDDGGDDGYDDGDDGGGDHV